MVGKRPRCRWQKLGRKSHILQEGFLEEAAFELAVNERRRQGHSR